MSRKEPTPAPNIPVRYGEESGRGPLPGPVESVIDVQVNGRCATLVVWHPTADDPPDDDLVVLTADGDGEVWPAFKLGPDWFDIDAGPMPAPRYWCHFPEAPTP